ncbi:GIY-YIG nuclease family protein [Arthrobacter sp. CAU 1506]|nr:GIY-YIG nuclease family protein [Arthrobacter sp. CAU 1506]
MKPRRYALRPWLIRALIPEGVIGAYVLWSRGTPAYVGRSDTSLRRRLLEHSQNRPHAYFTYDVVFSAHNAYAMECCLFHALADQTSNLIHPQRPSIHEPPCPFCIETVRIVRSNRLDIPSIPA